MQGLGPLSVMPRGKSSKGCLLEQMQWHHHQTIDSEDICLLSVCVFFITPYHATEIKPTKPDFVLSQIFPI